jgi:predicted RNA binding protein with dsRBD fold (UPF0201 family)
MLKENKIIKAIQKINPTAEVSVSEEDINTIVWENGTTPIPVADITRTDTSGRTRNSRCNS